MNTDFGAPVGVARARRWETSPIAIISPSMRSRSISSTCLDYRWGRGLPDQCQRPRQSHPRDATGAAGAAAMAELGPVARTAYYAVCCER